ncbi:MAG: preprotein translocase subunit SecG [Candidatus Moranbacteria bacterium]|nr:preprotein translocase subunit SecG [Candidatus Moranbacteria bacterium]
MKEILSLVQIISSVLLIVVILLQNREGGVSGILGGEGVGGSFYTKRGIEKSLLYATIILAVIFVGSAILSFLS